MVMNTKAPKRTTVAAVSILIATVVGCGRAPRPAPQVFQFLGAPGAPATSRDDLARVVSEMQTKLTKDPRDAKAAVRMADALLRQTRVTGNAGLAMRAESVLQSALAGNPDDYALRRMLATVYLSQHRFREALAQAEACRERQPSDAWVYGAIGDAHLELGDYDQAFDAFDRMAALKPNAASYARVSYARELQ